MQFIDQQRFAWAWRRLAISTVVAAVSLFTGDLVLGQGQTQDIGRWVEPAPVDGNYGWAEETMHALHLHTRQILMFYGPDCEEEEPRLYDIFSGAETTVPTPTGMTLGNCQGHCTTAHGWTFIVGGSCGLAEEAEDLAYKFDLNAPGGPWVQLEGGMSIGRWYPTVTQLNNSKILVFGGTGFGGSTGCPYNPEENCFESSHFPEIYDPATNQWDALEDAVRMEPWSMSYPFLYQIPEGRVACIGPAFIDDATSLLDLSGEGEWTDIDGHSGVSGDRGSAVMYEPGKVLMCGGWEVLSDCPTSSLLCPLSTPHTGIIDLSGPNPELAQWVINPTMNMLRDRRDHNLIVTPGGRIIAVGGLGSSCEVTDDPIEGCHCDCHLDCVCCTDDCDPVMEAEWIDPTAVEPVWTGLAEMTRPRGYHSVAVLMPDASILVSGGEEITIPPYDDPSLTSISAERFEPPYLFVSDGVYATRPVIGHAPATISYGVEFTARLATTTPIPTISKVCLIRPASVSHGFDQDQRRVPMTFQQTGTALQITAPPSGTHAPPGYYMLFVVDTAGVPSIARYVAITTPT